MKKNSENKKNIEPIEEVKKPYADEAKALMKVMDAWVILKETNPSPYNDIHEAVRKFLENFKKKK